MSRRDGDGWVIGVREGVGATHDQRPSAPGLRPRAPSSSPRQRCAPRWLSGGARAYRHGGVMGSGNHLPILSSNKVSLSQSCTRRKSILAGIGRVSFVRIRRRTEIHELKIPGFVRTNCSLYSAFPPASCLNVVLTLSPTW